ncbi:MAG: GGDEF domain-containing protein [Solirubrobacteraceae bacterium]|nr:GGDEF domain-containing protein [Solirubrobacteraceae bacterium]
MERVAAFFCPTDADRERLLELEETLRRPRVITYVAVAVTLAVLVPWTGWVVLLLVGVMAFLCEMVIRRRLVAGRTHPALVILVGFALNTVITGIGVAITGGAGSPLLPWMVIPIVSLAGRFDARGVWWGTGFVGLAIAVVVATSPSAFADNPAPAIAVLPLALSLGMFSAAMMRAERQQRTRSALDPLTGLLNRSSLPSRFGELAEQARLTGDSVALVALDIDRFKAINDTYGHARGDAVLRALAAAIRGELRSFELAYRLGGEEFLIVLPGVDLEHGAGVAERLRRRIAALRPDGLDVTASLGVSAAHGDAVELGALFDAADRALYAAKRGGRNRVEVAPPGDEARDGDGAPARPGARGR